VFWWQQKKKVLAHQNIALQKLSVGLAGWTGAT
jgi:hypothetical protein